MLCNLGSCASLKESKMHVKNITKNYSILNILIGEHYVTKSVGFLTKKEYFDFQVKKTANSSSCLLFFFGV